MGMRVCRHRAVSCRGGGPLVSQRGWPATPQRYVAIKQLWCSSGHRAARMWMEVGDMGCLVLPSGWQPGGLPKKSEGAAVAFGTCHGQHAVLLLQPDSCVHRRLQTAHPGARPSAQRARGCSARRSRACARRGARARRRPRPQGRHHNGLSSVFSHRGGDHHRLPYPGPKVPGTGGAHQQLVAGAPAGFTGRHTSRV